jgi:hypothetical protein
VIVVDGHLALTNVSFPKLQVLGGDLIVTQNLLLADLSLPMLVKVPPTAWTDVLHLGVPSFYRTNIRIYLRHRTCR